MSPSSQSRGACRQAGPERPRAGREWPPDPPGGELTGHHHAVDVLDRPQKPKPVKASDPGRHGDGAAAREGSSGALPGPALAERLVEANILARADLCVAFLTVEGRLRHGLPSPSMTASACPGVYYCGRQVESAGEGTARRRLKKPKEEDRHGKTDRHPTAEQTARFGALKFALLLANLSDR